MFSMILFNKKKKILSLSFELSSQPLTMLSFSLTSVVHGADLSRGISFAVVLGFADLRPISLSRPTWLAMGPIPLFHGGDLLVCGGWWWGFVEVVVGFCWFVVGLAVGQDVVAVVVLL